MLFLCLLYVFACTLIRSLRFGWERTQSFSPWDVENIGLTLFCFLRFAFCFVLCTYIASYIYLWHGLLFVCLLCLLFFFVRFILFRSVASLLLFSSSVSSLLPFLLFLLSTFFLFSTVLFVCLCPSLFSHVRFNKLDFGMFGNTGIPRLLDMGVCVCMSVYMCLCMCLYVCV